MLQQNKPELQVEGDDSPEIKVFANDVFPPAIPSGLQAVASGPGQKTFVDLVWAPVSDVDLDGYNVYRREEGAAPVKVNAALVKTPAYRDHVGRLGEELLVFRVCRRCARKRERTVGGGGRNGAVSTHRAEARTSIWTGWRGPEGPLFHGEGPLLDWGADSMEFSAYDGARGIE